MSGLVRMSYSDALQLWNFGPSYGPIAVVLWGDDAIWDNPRLGPRKADSEFRTQPDGLNFTYEACVDNSTLNEDDSWTDNRDEIYAEVRLVTHNWATIRSAQTNRVYGYF